MANTVKISSCELINADCLEFIRSLPENSVDLIVTDPPYFKVKPEGWDNQWKGDDDYLKWLDQCLAQFWRERMQQGKPAGVFPRHRAHSVRGTLSGAVSSERCRVCGEGQCTETACDGPADFLLS